MNESTQHFNSVLETFMVLLPFHCLSLCSALSSAVLCSSLYALDYKLITRDKRVLHSYVFLRK